ncbi:hypothetical protein CISIN_1g046422mg, partial [Citrus sinensis]
DNVPQIKAKKNSPFILCQKRDPGLRMIIKTYHIDRQEDVRMAYIDMRPFQLEPQKYPLTKHACAFRGHDESVNSLNRENFMELIKLLATMNEEINEVVLENASKNAQYIAPKIQNELLNILANKVQHKIRALDESHKKKMAIILRYVDCDGFIRERFFEVVNVDDIKASTLKNEICNVLARYNLLVENLRGQGHDGASNMSREWNGLQFLFLNDCPFVYYVHCFTHRLQLVLVAVSKKLSSIVNFVNDSFKRYSKLKAAKEKEIIGLIASKELETSTSANQVQTLQRPGDTRWSLYFTSVSRLIKMFSTTPEVLRKMFDDGSSPDLCGEAKGAYREMKSFEFVFILLSLDRALGISNILCQPLQNKIFRHLKCFEYSLELIFYFSTRCSCKQKDYVTVEHSYHFDIFNAVINFQLTDINSRFLERTLELLTLCSTLDPIDGFKLFDTDLICCLAEKFYLHDFTTNEIIALRRELEHYKFDLCRRLIETKKLQHYFLIDRLICLMLTLPISTATTECGFSAMSLIKTSLCNNMENEFISYCMVVYAEREIADTIDSDSIIDEFHCLKP